MKIVVFLMALALPASVWAEPPAPAGLHGCIQREVVRIVTNVDDCNSGERVMRVDDRSMASRSTDPTIASNAELANRINWNTIIIAFFSFLGTVMTGLVAMYVKRVNGNTERAEDNSLKTLNNSEQTKTSAAATTDQVEKIHIAVNSERTAMMQRIDELHATVLEMTKTKAKDDERHDQHEQRTGKRRKGRG
jgi:hypothetical protein